jgi:predicted MPP superfamily phosphohydrolase
VACVRHSLSVLPRGAAPLRVGFVSDIHIGPTTPPRLLDAAFSCLAAESLDVLLLGGDYVFLDATDEKAERLAALVRSVPAARKFAVLGNHDLWTHHPLLERALASVGVELLTNENVLLDSAGSIAIVGLDEPWTGKVDAVQAMRDLGKPELVLVLCHSPDGLPDAIQAIRALPGSPAALYVCGHTHGGHIATPWGPLVVPGQMGKKYPHGFHHVAPFHVHVSRGVGGIELPIRLYAAPEVAVFELLPVGDAG